MLRLTFFFLFLPLSVMAMAGLELAVTHLDLFALCRDSQ